MLVVKNITGSWVCVWGGGVLKTTRGHSCAACCTKTSSLSARPGSRLCQNMWQNDQLNQSKRPNYYNYTCVLLPFQGTSKSFEILFGFRSKLDSNRVQTANYNMIFSPSRLKLGGSMVVGRVTNQELRSLFQMAFGEVSPSGSKHSDAISQWFDVTHF